ncbi:MAG: PLP-dependent aminotransferase family protein [Bacteroidia bacterium]
MKTHLYQNLAQELEQSILNGVILVGEKLPSVRLLSREKALSASTVFQAYYHLEAKGLVEARDRSGYYVAYRSAQRKPLKNNTNIAPPDIRQLDTRTMIKQLEGVRSQADIQKLSMAVPDPTYLPAARLSKCMQDALRQYRDESLQYAPPAGILALRRLISAQLLSWWPSGRPEDVLITQGAMEGLSLCLRALCKRGEVIAMDELSYFGVHQLVEQLGLQVVPIPQGGDEGLDLDYLDQVLKQFPIKACLFVPTFHNPTGSSLSETKKQALVELLCQRRIPLIEDDVYGELYFGKKRPLPCKHYDKEGWVLYCSSFSKTLAPGYRVGYCMGGRFHEELLWEKRIHSHSSSTLPQLCLARFLEIGRYRAHLNKLRANLHTNMLKYGQLFLDAFPEQVRFLSPQGGMVYWIQMPEKLDARILFGQAQAEGIVISPGPIFASRPGFEHCFRLSFSSPIDPTIEIAIDKLGRMIANLLI